jgi:hypothetical protein
VDALVDLPFALPTAVAGITLTTLYSSNGWIGQYLKPLGSQGRLSRRWASSSPWSFISLPFVVRTVQPVLEDLEAEVEEAAASSGCRSLANFPARHFSGDPSGTVDRLYPGFRPRHRRVRLGHLHRRQSADGFGNHAFADRQQAGAVRL